MNNVNYDATFEEMKARSDGKRLLLHACCAPCSTYCLTQVLETFDVTLYYANDNIDGRAEWEKRLGELQKLVEIVNSGAYEVTPKYPLKLVVQDFDSQRFYNAARDLEQEKEGGARCTQCFELRLTDTLNYAETHSYQLFATTLTVSPYKNSQLINEIGLRLQTDKTQWLPADFKKRNGYNESVRLSNKYDLYRQHYCGCEFSLQQMQSDLK